MATRKTDQELKNETETELEVLQNIEKAYYRNNESAKSRMTVDSLKWFQSYVPRSFNKVRTAQLMRDTSLFEESIEPGQMYFFVYDALHKDKLPVWDRFPLVFPWDTWTKNGVRYFISINLHYLRPADRFVAMKALLGLRNQKRYKRNTKLRISWQILQNLSNNRFYKHAVKMYRMDQMRSLFIKVPAPSWELAVFLPVARWEGNKADAWSIKS